MSIIGHIVSLPILRVERDRIVLDGGRGREVPLPREEAPSEASAGETIEVFVLNDSEARPVATTATPHATLGRCASLQVVAQSGAGAFLDWGIAKHLLLPYAEQRRPLEVGQRECVLVYLDNSGRLAASARLDHRLDERPDGFEPWQRVSLLVCQRTDLGFKAVVDDRAVGLLYRDEIFRELRVGERTTGYVKRPRADGRLDLALQPPARALADDLAARVIEHLERRGGSTNLTDRSSPEDIRAAFGVSKKNYKRVLGGLYRERRVRLEPDRVVLVAEEGRANAERVTGDRAGADRGTPEPPA